jgi:hypothetical protein
MTSPDFGRSGGGRIHRGTRKRLRRIKLSKNTPIELWVLIALTLLALLTVIPRLIRHSPEEPRQAGAPHGLAGGAGTASGLPFSTM